MRFVLNCIHFVVNCQMSKCFPDGGAEGIRTPDLFRAREAFSQLNYCPVGFRSAQASQVGSIS